MRVLFWTIVAMLCPTFAFCGVDGFTETFRGPNNGLDNPGWSGSATGVFSDNGFQASGIGLSRPLTGNGSFRTSLLVENLDLGDVSRDDPPGTLGILRIFHQLDPGQGGSGLIADIKELEGTAESQWNFSAGVRNSPESGVANIDERTIVPQSSNSTAEFAIEFNSVRRLVTFSFDSDVVDDNPPIVLGPYDYDGRFSSDHNISLTLAASSDFPDIIEVSGLFDEFSVAPLSTLPGDFSADGTLNVDDINLLVSALHQADVSFDLNSDASVDFDDLDFWITELKGTYFGDANLDGEFASSDLVNIFAAGEYEDEIDSNSTWETGDWNGDAEFSTSDLVLAFQDGGYEQGPRVAVGVPEPAGWLALALGSAWLVHRRRHKVR